MKNLRDVLKYKKFKIIETGDIIYFDLTRIFKNEQFLSNYELEKIDNKYILKLISDNFSQPNNLWIIKNNGEKFLFNEILSKINHSLSLIELQEEQIPDDLRKKLDQLYN